MLFSPRLLRLLRQAQFDPDAVRGFDALAGGFRWSDEFPREFLEEARQQDDWTRRSLLAYRASIICGEKDDRDFDLWTQVKTEFPEWPGFRQERCDSRLAEELLANKDRVLAELETLFDDQD